MSRQYPVNENPLAGCKGIMTAIGCSGLIVLLMIVVLAVFSFTVKAQDCNYFDGNLVSDSTVPAPNTDHCDHQGRVSLVCGQVHVEAYIEGQFSIQEYPTQVYRELYLEAGQVYTYTPNPNTEWLEVWSEDGFLGLVDIIEQDCADDIVYPDDDRINWQLGDHFAKAFIEGDHLNVYSVTSGESVLVLSVDMRTVNEEVCTDDHSVCVYLLDTGEVQLNIIDIEGKLYELLVYTQVTQ